MRKNFIRIEEKAFGRLLAKMILPLGWIVMFESLFIGDILMENLFYFGNPIQVLVMLKIGMGAIILVLFYILIDVLAWWCKK